MKNSKDERSTSREQNSQENGPECKRLLKLPVTEETACGIWCFQGPNLQRFANKKAFVFLYSVLGCIFSASYAYFNGTITTIEKRFKIPSRTTGLITVGNDISQLFVSLVLSYYAGKGHRPRWIAVGIYTVVLFCFLTMLPHFLYGPGEDALLLTKEYGAKIPSPDDNVTTTSLIIEKQRKFLCLNRTGHVHCEDADGNFAPQAILFVAQLVSGIGGSLYYTLGVSYMDDNIKKSKTPALISYSYFLKMWGTAIGYWLASVALKFYISPTLTPTITMEDPRWLGAWWLGWTILAILLFVFANIFALFPKALPRAAARKAIALERNKSMPSIKDTHEPELPASFGDMMRTFKRLLTNTTLMYNNLAAVFYFMGYMPYWIFMPKYIEIQYKQSASVSSLITGRVGLIFSALGILVSGLIITKYKPRARYLAAWNVMVGVISVAGMISYAFLGCAANDNQIAVTEDGNLKTLLPCNQHCHCDYVTYNPVCSENGQTFISACHAGCKTVMMHSNGEKIYADCSCVRPSIFQVFSQVSNNLTGTSAFLESTTASTSGLDTSYPSGSAVSGACPINCLKTFYVFLAVVCLLKFVGATGRASNFLVSVRCVDEKDKTVAMGFGLTIMSLFAFVPSPILFGYILDKTCLVWGKTCSGTGNCWLYNAETLRYLMNLTAATFVSVGTVFDVGVWYYVKDVKIFEEEVELDNIAIKDRDDL